MSDPRDTAQLVAKDKRIAKLEADIDYYVTQLDEKCHRVKELEADREALKDAALRYRAVAHANAQDWGKAVKYIKELEALRDAHSEELADLSRIKDKRIEELEAELYRVANRSLSEFNRRRELEAALWEIENLPPANDTYGTMQAIARRAREGGQK